MKQLALHRLVMPHRAAALGAVLALAVLGAPRAASAAAIYIDSHDEGAISLSNLPGNPGYQLVLGDEVRAAAPAPRPEGRATGRGFAAKARFDGVVGEVAGAYGIDDALLHAVISVESAYNPRAVSPKGATGLMQLMPKTAQRYGVANALDPVQNLHGGARYLRHLLKLFNSNLPLVIAAYNAGENAVVKHGHQIPPYRETINYVPKVLDYYALYQGAPSVR